MTAPQSPAPLRVQRPGNIQAVLDLLGITDQFPFELIPAVLPVVSFERPSPTREVRGSIGRVGITGAVAEYGQIQLFNPEGSGILVQPEYVILQRADAGEIGVRNYDTALTSSIAAKTWRDRRVGGTPVGQIRSESNATRLGTLFASAYAQGANIVTRFPFTSDFVLDEGQGVALTPETVQKTIVGVFFWTEVRKSQ